MVWLGQVLLGTAFAWEGECPMQGVIKGISSDVGESKKLGTLS